MVNGGDSQPWPWDISHRFMSTFNHFDELRTARKEGVQPLHRSDTSDKKPDRFHELRTARREGQPLPQSNTSKKRDGTTEGSHAYPGSRYRRPTPHQVEHRRQDDVAEAYPKGDSPLIDDLRRRIRSPPPPRTRATTPHPRASARRITKKTVRWADPLEQPTPERIRSERNRRDSEKPKNDGNETLGENRSCTIRRYRPSSIPRPKRRGAGVKTSKPSRFDRRPTPSFTIELVLAPQDAQSLQRPLSPLIPQAMPAPLRISPTNTSTRQSPKTIPSSSSAPAIQAKPPARSFSFEGQPEVITLSPDSRRPEQRPVTLITQEQPSLCQPTSFSYLKEKPRRRGTVPPHLPEARPTSAVVVAENSEPSLPSSSSTSSFQSAKSFWSDISSGSNKNRHSSSSKTSSPIKSDPGPSDATSAVDRASTPPSKTHVSKLPIASSASSSSFHAVKSFWSEISTSSSCGAIIDGEEDVKPPCGPSAISGRVDLCKTSKVADLARYTVNGPAIDRAQNSISRIPVSRPEGGSVGRDRYKSKIPVSSTASYHVTKTQPSRYVPLRAVIGISASGPGADAGSPVSGTGSASTSSFHTAKSHPSDSSDNNAYASGSKTSILQSNDSVQAEDTPALQAQLWHDVLTLCSSDLASCSPDCGCDDCLWSHHDDLDRCSMVAHVDDGKCRDR
ncbi:hypothetical protein NEUTE1DRAFT_110539 [Neurospora tetrasperma FGSC 2508]|uniref:Uncharacterized protein n=1 Tax=Neurospora tetrasperma (strain FGSC 2508 / ATCC MYA-4615 / P0657) TaxID=510951 RepID=F8MLL2_NEUT8|nr:uncharacterized protein NEUTE1DRAFT_110539 [Neurospora tetrasperma FGSC 2508]EGO58431.1 hypothetical protein NEUTE1DRAFT_110539 [Neurospora tetrasperma FGSC 2508]